MRWRTPDSSATWRWPPSSGLTRTRLRDQYHSDVEAWRTNAVQARKKLRDQYHSDVEAWRTNAVHRRVLEGIVEELRSCEKPVPPMHWEIEFPEVFERENPGFDAIVGNPPFAGHVSVVGANKEGYTDWLRLLHPESTGKCDLVAHFYRRAFGVIRKEGAFGLIATNTIAQGDTRASGLRWICTQGGEIFDARKRVKWPGLAAVVVSVVHVAKGPFACAKWLDGREVPAITAFLFHRGGHDDPARLAANAGESFVGSYVLGMGFAFDDTDTKGVATPLAEMRRLIERDPGNRGVIFPYIGGGEVNSSPTHSHHRYVINFGVRSEDECRKQWPDLLKIVEAKVKPERLKRFSDSPCTAWARRGTSACTNAGGPMQAYSMDLRERALLDSDAGMKAADVAVKYRVSGSWVRLLKQRRRETGDVAPRVQRHGRRRMLEPHLHTLAALIAEQPDRTLAELKDALGTPASLATIWRAVAALDVTVKKNGPALRTRST